jgi:phenylacetate-coenzyme A ligase PaaK-like adenylate-forming protein
MKLRTTPLDSWINQKIAHQGRLTREAIEDYQLTKLRETLALVRRRSPFYQKQLRQVPDQISSLGDLAQYPFTTAQDLHQHGTQFLCVSQDEVHRVVTLQSSGTTGQPKRIYFTAEDQELTIDFFDVGMSTFTETGESVLILLPGETPGSVGDLLRIGLLRHGRIPLPYGPVRDPQHALETMQSLGADCLVGSPTQVLGLARRWQPGNKAPRAVLLSTDYAPTSILHELKQTWRCQVFDHYGMTEMGLGGGVECEAHRGYHLREADLLFEIIDPVSGEVLPDGEYGEVVITTITRRGMPLVRYRTGDRSRFLLEPCPCGTDLRTLERISGRFSGFIRIGQQVLKLADFDEVLFPIPGLLNFTISVANIEKDPSIHIEVQMLNDEDCTPLIEQALATIPAVKGLKVTVHCKHTPMESGSLRKRIFSMD